MLRTVNTNPEIIGHAIRDALNAYTREILIAKGVVQTNKLDELDSPLTRHEVNLIIEIVVKKWQVCEIEDD